MSLLSCEELDAEPLEEAINADLQRREAYIVISATVVVFIVFCAANQDMSVPFIVKIADVANREVHILVLLVLDERREAEVVF